jgi:hypothetical protein
MPKQPKINTIAKAASELRRISGESQQFFGARLRISTKAIQLYEDGSRIPEPKQLVAFAVYADSVNRFDLSRLFIDELERQLAPPIGYRASVLFGRLAERFELSESSKLPEIGTISADVRRKK